MLSAKFYDIISDYRALPDSQFTIEEIVKLTRVLECAHIARAYERARERAPDFEIRVVRPTWENMVMWLATYEGKKYGMSIVVGVANAETEEQINCAWCGRTK